MFSNIFNTKNPEDIFWDWFKKNNDKFSNFRNENSEKQEKIVDEILEHLHECCSNLWIQIGGTSDEYTELIITASGNKDYFVNSRTLVEKAPQIAKWKIISLMPPLDVDEINYSDVYITLSDLAYRPVINFEDITSICIAIYVKDYSEKSKSENFETAMHTFLEQIVGEECYGYVSYVDFEEWQEGIESNITDLHNYIMTKKEGYEK